MTLHPHTFAELSDDPMWWWCIPCGSSNRGAFCALCGRHRRDATDAARWRRDFLAEPRPPLRLFDSPYTVDVPFTNGTPVRVIRAIRHPDAEHDAEVLPMYVIETEDGRTGEAYPEELGPARRFVPRLTVSGDPGDASPR